jgi:3',5'-cyclic AMP phosphodiesterase CpdA
MVLIPGNHDIEIAADEISPRPTEEYKHERRFRDFLRSFYGEDIKEIESLRKYRTTNDWHVAVVGLNSVRLRTPETKEYGYVGDRSAPSLQRLQEANADRGTHELARERMLNVVTLHHHLLPGELLTRPEKNRPVSMTLDSGQVVADCQRAGVHLVLHGHQHIPFLGSTSRARRRNGDWEGHDDKLFVIGSGSTGASRERLSDELRNNTFGIYRAQGTSLHIRVEQFTPRMEAYVYMETDVHL